MWKLALGSQLFGVWLRPASDARGERSLGHDSLKNPLPSAPDEAGIGLTPCNNLHMSGWTLTCLRSEVRGKS